MSVSQKIKQVSNTDKKLMITMPMSMFGELERASNTLGASKSKIIQQGVMLFLSSLHPALKGEVRDEVDQVIH